MFIEINSDQISSPITTGDVYGPPYDNNNDHNTGNLLLQFTPVIDRLSMNNLHAVGVGDYDIDLKCMGTFLT